LFRLYINNGTQKIVLYQEAGEFIFKLI